MLVASQEEKHLGFLSGKGPALGALPSVKAVPCNAVSIRLYGFPGPAQTLQVVPVSDAPSAGQSMPWSGAGWVLSFVHAFYLVMCVGCVNHTYLLGNYSAVIHQAPERGGMSVA